MLISSNPCPIRSILPHLAPAPLTHPPLPPTSPTPLTPEVGRGLHKVRVENVQRLLIGLPLHETAGKSGSGGQERETAGKSERQQARAGVEGRMML